MRAALVWTLLLSPSPPPVIQAGPAAPVAHADQTAPVVRYADLALELAAGRASVLEVLYGRFDRPTALARYRGRFEARVLHKGAILERVRFDFPLAADAETDDASDEARAVAERLRAGITARTRLRVPLPDGADAIAIWDPRRGLGVLVPVINAAGASGGVKARPAGPPPAAKAGAPPAP
jgi:hypothetical protein